MAQNNHPQRYQRKQSADEISMIEDVLREGQGEFEAFENFKPKEKLSYGFDIDEASLCAETEIQTKLLIQFKDLSSEPQIDNKGVSERLHVEESDEEVNRKKNQRV